jgi:tetratricopeptide (TPR) repeat protein
VKPASVQSLVDALIATRDQGARRALIDASPAPVSIDLVRQLEARIRDCLRKDIVLADSLVETCFILAERLGQDAGWAFAHRSRAYVLTNRRKCSDAVPLYETSARLFSRAGELRELGRTRVAQAENLTYLSDYGLAQEMAREAHRLLRSHGDADDVARVHIFAGNLLNRLNRYRDALEEYDQARRLLGEGGSDPLVVAAVEMNRASPLVELNRFEEALESLERARAYCNRHSIPVWSDILDRNIARLYFSVGRYSDALRSLAGARARYESSGDAHRRALCDQASAEIYLHLNLFTEAGDLAERARATFRGSGSRFEVAQCLGLLGMARSEQGDPTARNCFLEAMDSFREEGHLVYVASTSLQLARLDLRTGDDARALEHARRAVEGFEAAGLDVRAAYGRVIAAEAERGLGFDDAALEGARRALDQLSGYHAGWVSYQARALLASILARGGRRDEAERLYRMAIADIESLRGNLELDEFRTSFGRDKYEVYEALIALRIDAGDTEDAFRLVERSRSRTLLDLLGHGTRSIWITPDEGPARQEVRKLGEELNGLYSRLSQPGSTTGRSVPNEALRESIRERERKMVELLRRAASEEEPWAALEARPGADISEVQALLAEDETLIEYYTIRDRFCAFVVDRRGLDFVADLAPVAEVERSLKGLGFQLSKFHLGEDYLRDREGLLLEATRFHLRNLYRMLVEPLERRVGSPSLVVVPHGLGHSVPFHALYDGTAHLVDRYDLVYAASSTVLGICRRAPEPRGGRDLVLAVPDAATPAILDEAEMLRDLLPDADVFIGEEATGEVLARFGASARRVHIAAHGVFRRDNPMFSSLKLGSSWLNLVDVFNLKLGSELTTLSACESGMSGLYGGDELLGLTQGFLYAGTPSLLVSLWRVNDRSTSRLMKRFYQELERGTPKPASLRQAMLEVKADHPHPYYWAPFVLLGRS